MIPEPDEYLSFLIAASGLSDDHLDHLSIRILSGANSRDRRLLIPAVSLEAYQALVQEHLTPGFWNEVVGRHEILFLFKFRDGNIEKIIYSPDTRHRIATLCTAFNKDPIEKTSDLPRYLAGNALYRDLILACHSSCSSLVVVPANSDAEIQCACDIMIEAADWLTARGQALWNRDSLIPANICPSPEKGALFLAHLSGQPVGTFQLLFEDPFFWPDVPQGEALYLHKLTVRRSLAGRGLGHRILEHAAVKAREAGKPFLRLDCAIRPKLCAFYESAGFQRHSDRNMGSFAVRRYQWTTETEYLEPASVRVPLLSLP